MSLDTKIIMNISKIISEEVEKYSELIKEKIDESLASMKFEEMVLKITNSIAADHINERITLLLHFDDRIHELVLKKLKESIGGVNIEHCVSNAAMRLIEDIMKDKFRRESGQY